MKSFVISVLVILFAVMVNTSVASAQRRDYMTDEEIELVRDNQDIDKRVDVLTKMVDRRFAALGINVGGWNPSEKEQKLWGQLQTGTRSQMLSDIRQILQKAIYDIEDVSEHNANTQTQNKTEGLLFPKAVRGLAAAANRYLPALKSTLDKTTDTREKGSILNSIESCEAIMESVANLPPEVTPEKKSDKKKGKT